MSDNERSIAELARLHAEIIKERAAGLQESAQTAQSRLLEREEAMVRLRMQIAALKTSIAAASAPRPVVSPIMPAAAPAAARPVAPITPSPRNLPAPMPMPMPMPAPRPVAVSLAPSPRAFSPIPAPARPKEAVRTSAAATASSARAGFATLAPYLAIVAFAAVFELRSGRHEAVPADMSDLARPAATVVSAGRAAAKGAPVVGDEDRSQEAMLLVHEWKLPGDDKTLGDRLGGEVEMPGTRPAWSVERTGERAYRVTYQLSAESAPYSFEADLESRVVWPAPDTAELLAPRLASLRDSVR